MNIKKKTFEKQMLAIGAIPNLTAAIIVIIYITFFAGLGGVSVVPIIIEGVIIAGCLQLFIAPLTNKALTKNLSEDLEEWEQYSCSQRKRTKLLKKVMSCPSKIDIQVFIVFSIGVVFWTTSFYWLFNVDINTVILATFAALVASFMASILSLYYAQKLCSSYGIRLVRQGVDKEEVDRKHFFGSSSVNMVLLHIIIPIIIINLISLLFTWRASVLFNISTRQQILQLIVVCLFNLIISLSLSYILFKRMMISIAGMRKMLESMDDGYIQNIKKAPTDLSNEFMYNVYLINQIIDLLQNILKKSVNISEVVIESGNELFLVSKDTASTSIQLASSIKELLSAMEESDALSRNIAAKIAEVTIVARKTTQDVQDGYSILEENMQKLEEIRLANETTLIGIKTLSEKISGISDIAQIINAIADQTNIIAFNAELEAAGAGDEGKNFYLVANEIRRLTNNTIESTKEIHRRIIEIQHTSDDLLLTSENGRNRILEGGKIADQLQLNFDDIKKSAREADLAAESIKLIIQQQTAAFEQIVVTLRQIAAGVENFSDSTQIISQSAEDLCLVAENLKAIQSMDLIGENDE